MGLVTVVTNLLGTSHLSHCHLRTGTGGDRPLTRVRTGTMVLLFFLPLLLAHPPINVQPRASVLRRMPLLYGKRDPSYSSPSAPYAGLPPSFASLDPGENLEILQEWTERVKELLRDTLQTSDVNGADFQRQGELGGSRPDWFYPESLALLKILDNDFGRATHDDIMDQPQYHKTPASSSKTRRLRVQLLEALMSDAVRSTTDNWFDKLDNSNSADSGLDFDDRLRSRTTATDGYDIVP